MHELEEEFRVIEVGGLIENCVDDIQESVDVVGQERLRAGRLPISRLEQELWIARFLVLPNGTGAGIDNFHQEPSYDSLREWRKLETVSAELRSVHANSRPAWLLIANRAA